MHPLAEARRARGALDEGEATKPVVVVLDFGAMVPTAWDEGWMFCGKISFCN